MANPLPEEVAAAKSDLRKALLVRRRTRPTADRSADDTARLALVRQAVASARPDTVAAYLSMGTEPDTSALLGWLHAEAVTVLLPVVSSRADGSPCSEPGWAAYAGPDALGPARGGIRGPTGRPLPAQALAEADLVLCPGLAGTPRGDRLGRGGGWYDRALRHRRPDAPVWLLLNDDEVLPTLPTAPWDRPVDLIITPTRLIVCPG